MAMDKCFLAMQFFVGDRAGDLTRNSDSEVFFLPNSEGVILNHTYGKTLRGDSRKLAVLKAIPGALACPLKALEQYLQVIEEWGGENLNPGFLFRTARADGITDQKLQAPAFAYRFRLYLEQLGINEGETPHGVHSAASITLALTGAASSLQEVMGYVGWATPGVAESYMALHNVLGEETVSSRLAVAMAQTSSDQGGVSEASRVGQRYRQAACTSDLQQVFPGI